MHYSIRNIMATLVAQSNIKGGIVNKRIAHLTQNKVILSLYTHNPDKDFFEKCIKWLLKKGFHFISINELHKIIAGEMEFPFGAVLLTADDGWRENKNNIIQIADAYHVPITIFVTTEPVLTGDAYWWSYIEKGYHLGLTTHTVNELKKMKNEDRLKILAAVKSQLKTNREALSIEELNVLSNNPWITIGSHTITHPILNNCSDTTSFKEIYESRIILGNWLDKEINSFSYPNGDFTSREINYVKMAGYQFAFTTSEKLITPENINEVYTLPRIDLLETISFAENICRMTGVWFTQKEKLKAIVQKYN